MIHWRVMGKVRRVTPQDIRRWKEVRDGTGIVLDEHWSVEYREIWLRERELKPLSEHDTPSVETLWRRKESACLDKRICTHGSSR